MKNTDLYKYLLSHRNELLGRIAGTKGEWKKHWEAEMEAVLRCLAALDDA
jgi:hypothetical protein